MYPLSALIVVFLTGVLLGAVAVGAYRVAAAPTVKPVGLHVSRPAPPREMTERELNALPDRIADPEGGPSWEHQEGDYYFQPPHFEMRYHDLIARVEHVRTRTDLNRAKQSGARLGHTKADGLEDFDVKEPGYIQLRHRGPNGHDAPGPWDRCEWPSDDKGAH